MGLEISAAAVEMARLPIVAKKTRIPEVKQSLVISEVFVST